MIKFTDSKDREKRKELLKLFDDWKKIIESKPQILFPDDGKYYDPIRYFNIDGFFPGYFASKPRILFIGRESRKCSNDNGIVIDRIDEDLDNWLAKSGLPYWRRILYLTYGIKMNGAYRYEDIPESDNILLEMIKNNNYGFALMNISKYSNDSDSGGTADYTLINRFLEDSELEKRNFIREEIELLEPDIIITSNLWNEKIEEKYLEMIFPNKDISNPHFDDNKKRNACLSYFC